MALSAGRRRISEILRFAQNDNGKRPRGGQEPRGSKQQDDAIKQSPVTPLTPVTKAGKLTDLKET